MITITDFQPEAVVLGAGDYPRHPLPHAFLAHPRLVCCDGAANAFLSTGQVPWRIVGDGDSLAEAYRRQYASIVRRFADQETNDQTKAVTYLHARGIRRIAIVAATGRREDHTLGNISLLADYLHAGVEARIYTDHGVFIPLQEDADFRCPAGTQVSIFNFSATGLRGKGLRYPLSDFTNWWQGTLNETTGDTFTIRAQGTYLVFINYPE